MGVDFTRTRRRGVHIELTPLIDVVFQLLVFFMLSATFASPMLELTLPQVNREAETGDEQVVLFLDQEQQLFLNGDAVTLETLPAALGKALADAGDTAVYFRGDKAAAYEQVLMLMQLASEAGAAHFNFVYEPES